jgi:hypothetical protein
MTRRLCLLALALAASGPLVAQPAVEGPLDRVLGAVVGPDGRVDYGLLARGHRADLDAALRAVAQTDPADLDADAERTAFLVNAYNAHVLRLVLEHGATDLERQGLFDAFFQTPVRVAGLDVTLNELEHGALRRQDHVDGRPVPSALRALRPRRLDHRIHVAVNCAAVSCPPLGPRAFRAATLNGDLARAWREFVASDRAARFEGGALVLSSLFDWFADDFEEPGRPLGAFLAGAFGGRADAARLRERLAGRSAEALRRDPRVRFAYDWRVSRG